MDAAEIAASSGLYCSITRTATSTSVPSSTASTNCVVRPLWMVWMEPKRDTTSPTCRFSKYDSGSRIRCAKALPSHWKLSVVVSTVVSQDRTAPIEPWSSASSRKPTPSTVTRSRSALTSASSTIHCRYSGPSSTHTCRATASSRIVDDGCVGVHLLQHHEVVHVPVQQAWQFQLRQVLQVELQRTGLQLQ